MMSNTSGVPRIGDILVSQNRLTVEQADIVYQHQKSSGRPFGELAERLFDVAPRAVEAAWQEQYLALGTHVDLDREQIDPAVRDVLTRRRAWQFQLLPLRREDGVLVLAASAGRLNQSVTLLWRIIDEPVYAVVAEPEQLRRYLSMIYPSPWARQAWPKQAGAAVGPEPGLPQA